MNVYLDVVNAYIEARNNKEEFLKNILINPTAIEIGKNTIYLSMIKKIDGKILAKITNKTAPFIIPKVGDYVYIFDQ